MRSSDMHQSDTDALVSLFFSIYLMVNLKANWSHKCWTDTHKIFRVARAMLGLDKSYLFGNCSRDAAMATNKSRKIVFCWKIFIIELSFPMDWNIGTAMGSLSAHGVWKHCVQIGAMILEKPLLIVVGKNNRHSGWLSQNILEWSWPNIQLW